MALFTVLIIAVTVVFSYLGFTKYGFVDRYLFDVQRIIQDKQYYRIITSGFLHANLGHLIFNMFSLYSFGEGIELLFGPITFLIIYFVSIIGGGLLSLILHRNHEYRALGASGGVCGIIFACIFLMPGSSVYMFFIPYPIPAHIYAVAFLAISYVGIRGQVGNIGHDAHLGGAIIGLATTTAMYPYIIKANPIMYPAVAVLSIAMLLLFYFDPLDKSEHAYKVTNIRPKRKKKIVFEKPPAQPTDDEILNRLLEKVSKKGINSLSYVEVQQLERISKSKRQPKSAQ